MRIIEPFIPPERWGGRTRGVDMPEVLNGILLGRYRRLSRVL